MSEKIAEKPVETPESPAPEKSKGNRPLQLTSDNSRRVRITRWICRLLNDLVFIKTACKVTVTGLENVPPSGPTILLFNHVTLLDPLMAGGLVRSRDLVPIGKQELNRPPIGWITWAWGSIPLRRGELDMTALRRAMMVLESSDMLMIAPEGTRHREGLGEPKEGFVMLAARSNAVMLPVGVSGTEKLGYNVRRLRRTPVTVNYGRPVRLKGKINRQQYKQAADEVMYQIALLIDPHLRGRYSEVSKASMDLIEYL